MFVSTDKLKSLQQTLKTFILSFLFVSFFLYGHRFLCISVVLLAYIFLKYQKSAKVYSKTTKILIPCNLSNQHLVLFFCVKFLLCVEVPPCEEVPHLFSGLGLTLNTTVSYTSVFSAWLKRKSCFIKRKSSYCMIISSFI